MKIVSEAEWQCKQVTTMVVQKSLDSSKHSCLSIYPECLRMKLGAIVQMFSTSSGAQKTPLYNVTLSFHYRTQNYRDFTFIFAKHNTNALLIDIFCEAVSETEVKESQWRRARLIYYF